MLKTLSVNFKYDGSPAGDIDRDAFMVLLTAELDNDNVVKNGKNPTGGTIESIAGVLDTNIVTATIHYQQNNAGITAFEAFKSVCDTELAKATVEAGPRADGMVSYIYTDDCGHDVGAGRFNAVKTTK